MNTYYSIAKLIVKIYQSIFSLEARVKGIENIPQGAKIIAANHPNATDAFHLPFIIKEQLHFLVQGSFFKFPLIGWILSGAEQIPVQASQKSNAFEKASEWLSRGHTIVLFPEGRLNPDNKLVKTGTGAVRLSLLSGAPIVPLGIHVPERFLTLFTWHGKTHDFIGKWQTSGHAYLQFGQPWYLARELQHSLENAPIHELTNQLLQKISMLARTALPETATAPVE